MNCPQCGRENSGAAAICEGCGHSLGEVKPPAGVVQKVPARLHRLSVISLALGLTAWVLSFYLFGSSLGDMRRYRFVSDDCTLYGLLIALPALVCGHVSRFRIKRSQGNLWGKNIAAAGLVMGYFFPIFSCFWLIPCSPRFIPHWSAIIGNCWSNMKVIDMACKEYARNHEGKYPEKLSQLYPQYIEVPELLSCPGNTPAPFTKEDLHDFIKHIDNNSNYVYYPGSKETDPPKKVVLQDKPDNHWYKGINVLHVDGTVTWEPVNAKSIPPAQK